VDLYRQLVPSVQSHLFCHQDQRDLYILSFL
jgi:hypothetical protein